jgi:hypothetical protein
MCLLYFRTEGIYSVWLLGIDDVGHLRATKAAALEHLGGRGFDLCRITAWRAGGALDPREKTLHDRFGLPFECRPLVVAADRGAEPLLSGVEKALDWAIDVTAEDLGWRPRQQITVMVVTEPAGVARASRLLRAGETDRLADLTRRGGSYVDFGWGELRAHGTVIYLNLTTALARSPGLLRSAILHEYTHIAQYGLVDSARLNVVEPPAWLVEGQARHQERQYAPHRLYADLLVASAYARAGLTPRLQELTTSKQWYELVQTDRVHAAYAKAYAAYGFLERRFGPRGGVELLRATRGLAPDDLEDLLLRTFGVDLATLDRQVEEWLQGLQWRLAVTMDGATIALLPTPDHPEVEAGVWWTIDRLCLDPASREKLPSGQALVVAGGELRSDDTFSAGGPDAGFRLEGRLQDDVGIAGTLHVTGARPDCERIGRPFGPPTERVQAPPR